MDHDDTHADTDTDIDTATVKLSDVGRVVSWKKWWEDNYRRGTHPHVGGVWKTWCDDGSPSSPGPHSDRCYPVCDSERRNE